MASGSFAASYFSLLTLFLLMPHTSRMSYLSFFRKSALQRFWLLQEAGKLQETAQAGAVTSDTFSSFACCEAQGDPHLAPFPYIPPAPSHPMCISHSLQRSLCGSCWAACWLQNPSRAFHQWELDPHVLPHTAGSLALKSVGSRAQKLLRLSQGAGSAGDSHPAAPTAPSSV